MIHDHATIVTNVVMRNFYGFLLLAKLIYESIINVLLMNLAIKLLFHFLNLDSGDYGLVYGLILVDENISYIVMEYRRGFFTIQYFISLIYNKALIQ